MRAVACVATLLVLAVACVVAATAASPHVLRGAAQSSGGRGGMVQGKWFDRVMIIMLENKSFTEVSTQAYFQSLASLGTLLSQYYAVDHPSQPNYLATLAGNHFGINDDHPHTVNATVQTLVDQLEGAGVSWKAYMENYATNLTAGECFMSETYGFYARRHNPFITFDSVTRVPARCDRIVNADALWTDIAEGTAPQFIYYTPNVLNDCHNTPLDFAATYMQQFFNILLSKIEFMRNTAIVLTFDEDDYTEGNRIYTLLMGPVVRPKSTDDAQYNHYSFVRTVQDNWQLGQLSTQVDAPAFAPGNFIPQPTPPAHASSSTAFANQFARFAHSGGVRRE